MYTRMCVCVCVYVYTYTYTYTYTYAHAYAYAYAYAYAHARETRGGVSRRIYLEFTRLAETKAGSKYIKLI